MGSAASTPCHRAHKLALDLPYGARPHGRDGRNQRRPIRREALIPPSLELTERRQNPEEFRKSRAGLLNFGNGVGPVGFPAHPKMRLCKNLAGAGGSGVYDSNPGLKWRAERTSQLCGDVSATHSSRLIWRVAGRAQQDRAVRGIGQL